MGLFDWLRGVTGADGDDGADAGAGHAPDRATGDRDGDDSLPAGFDAAAPPDAAPDSATPGGGAGVGGAGAGGGGVGPGSLAPDGGDGDELRTTDEVPASTVVHAAVGTTEDPREELRTAAGELAEFWEAHDLDYSPASVGRLDRFVDSQWADKDRFRGVDLTGDGREAQVYPALVVQLGSYFGETLVRAYGGEWTPAGDTGWVVAVPPGPDADDGDVGDGPGASDADGTAAGGLADGPGAEGGDAGPGVDTDGDGGDAADVARRYLSVPAAGPGSGDAGPDAGFDDGTATVDVFAAAADSLVEPARFGAVHDRLVAELGLDGPTVAGDGDGAGAGGGDVAGAGGTAGAGADVDATADAGAGPTADAGARAGSAAGDAPAGDGPGTGGEDAGAGATPAEIVEGLRTDAVRLADRHEDYDLDFSPASLERLDALAADRFESERARFRDAEVGEDGDEDSLLLTSHAMEFGGYVAEVFTDDLDAKWDPGEMRLVVPGPDAAALVDPVSLAADCIRGEDSFAATYDAVRARTGLGDGADADAGGADGPDGREDPDA